MENNDNYAAPVNETPAPAPSYEPQPQYQPAPAAPVASEPADKAMLYSIAAYVLFFWFIGLLAKPENEMPFVKNHVNNGIIIFLGEIAATVISLIFGLIGDKGVVGTVFGIIFGVCFLGICGYGIWKAIKHEEFNFPVAFLAKIQLIK